MRLSISIYIRRVSFVSISAAIIRNAHRRRYSSLERTRSIFKALKMRAFQVIIIYVQRQEIEFHDRN